jgi:hypothetical protein
MRRAWVASAAAAAVLFCASSAMAFGYQVKPGDTFAGLAKRFYGSSSGWERIAKANAGRLVPGRTILIPEEGDPKKPAARVAALEGSVSLRAPADEGWTEAKSGEPLPWQWSLRTAKGATARLVLSGSATVRVAPESELTVLGDTGGRLRIALESGGVEMESDTPAALEIVVGDRIWALDGRSAALHRTASHVVTGAAFGRVRSVEVVLESGKAGRFRLDGTAEQRVTLPAPPRYGVGDSDIVLGFAGAVELSWTAPDPSPSFDVELDGQRQRVSRSRARLPVAQTGFVRARVRGRCELGIPGRWAERTLFALVAEANRAPVVSQGDEDVRFVGAPRLRFRDLPRGSSLFARVDGGLPRKLRDSLTLHLAGVGDHTLRLQGTVVAGDKSVEMDASVHVVVAPIPNVEVEFTPRFLDPLVSPPDVRVVVRLADEQQQPVTGERPVVTVGARSCVAAPTRVPGEYKCSLRPRAAPGIESLELVVKGQGDSFVASRQFVVKLPSEAAIRVK